ncbi:DUF6328 family protein [Kitasatospora kifunensis]|uniref:Uncharacterized protein n=1 Tax=Kitasatospora kifunensis TaxID=58351 RepID=A0A7W7QWX2_KITKI|nr:DUF6328 family protein [Kitasatospora kifunensis]MBB4921038.1 hypothetical protein [Kitasatospora kifunensis]
MAQDWRDTVEETARSRRGRGCGALLLAPQSRAGRAAEAVPFPLSASPGSATGAGPFEQERANGAGSAEQSTDRAYGELLQEIRIALCGVQFLFAFLLALACTPTVAHGGPLLRGAYLAALLSSAGSMSALLAPAAFHRAVSRRRLRPQLVAVANRCLVAGLAMLALTFTLVLLLLVLVVVVGLLPGLGVAAGGLAWFVLLWLWAPIRCRNRSQENGDGHQADQPRLGGSER